MKNSLKEMEPKKTISISNAIHLTNESLNTKKIQVKVLNYNQSQRDIFRNKKPQLKQESTLKHSNRSTKNKFSSMVDLQF